LWTAATVFSLIWIGNDAFADHVPFESEDRLWGDVASIEQATITPKTKVEPRIGKLERRFTGHLR
jgi:hypothetical protein